MYPFKNVEEIDNSMFLGGGAGYFSKTVSYILFDEEKDYDGVDFTRDLLKKTTPYKHKHEKDRDISPHMQKCTRCNGKCMKWVSVRLNWHRLFCDAGKEQL